MRRNLAVVAIIIATVVSTAGLLGARASTGRSRDVYTPTTELLVYHTSTAIPVQNLNPWSAADRAIEITNYLKVRQQVAFFAWIGEISRQHKLAAEAAVHAQTRHKRVTQHVIQQSSPTTTPAPVIHTDSNSCVALIRSIWKTSVEWAIGIAYRESGCTSGARASAPCSRNGDHAIGVFQLCMPMHQAIYASVGCASSWWDMACQIKAAWALFGSNGTDPWKL